MRDSVLPLSLRITRFLLWCGLIGNALTYLLGSILVLFGQGSSENSMSRDPALIARVLIGAVITIGLMGLALRGIQQRKPYGRWLSVIFLVILVTAPIDELKDSRALQIVFTALMQGQLPPAEGKLTDDSDFITLGNSYLLYRGYPNLALNAFVDALSAFALMVLPGFLTIRLIFSQAVKRFFS
jgi:hypothetical protein